MQRRQIQTNNLSPIDPAIGFMIVASAKFDVPSGKLLRLLT